MGSRAQVVVWPRVRTFDSSVSERGVKEESNVPLWVPLRDSTVSREENWYSFQLLIVSTFSVKKEAKESDERGGGYSSDLKAEKSSTAGGGEVPDQLLFLLST